MSKSEILERISRANEMAKYTGKYHIACEAKALMSKSL